MFTFLSWVLATVFIVCFTLVVAKMMQQEHMILGWSIVVACIFLGLGFTIAFIVGWIKAETWKIRPIMVVWTIAVAAFIILCFVHPTTFSDVRQRMHDLISELSD